MQINKFRIFCNERDKDFPARCRISRTLINKDIKGKKKIKRNDWIQIKDNSTGQKIYRQAQGNSSAQDCQNDFTKDAIEFDYDTSDELNIRKEKTVNDNTNFRHCNLTIRKATILESLFANWFHPEYGYRVSFQLGLIGLITGIIGLITSFVPFIFR